MRLRSTGYGTSPLIEETNHRELADAIVKLKAPRGAVGNIPEATNGWVMNLLTAL